MYCVAFWNIILNSHDCDTSLGVCRQNTSLQMVDAVRLEELPNTSPVFMHVLCEATMRGTELLLPSVMTSAPL